MGNCQAAEAATVVIQHSGGKKVDRIYRSVSANQIMNSNPGHYVAQLLTSPENSAPAKQLKLLRPDDTLVIGQVYRLISFEDVLKEFAAKKSVKLGKLLKERGTLNMEQKQNQAGFDLASNSKSAPLETEPQGHGSGGSGSGSGSSRGVDRRQWRPALQSIAELGS
ncbi:hypothetical protein BUALT_Bualt11G0067200 [Buddleja alternifolia]|uniref:Uncharacterized protein n=1 Tax=Buddleja alternifolia TaxID=168488 RepID=A0AAV6WS26_9LAMI|nr:hypothetical protein BUALT_Bualt11G0067200 [Buddleja alternifolia]